MAPLFRKWFMSHEKCVKESPINNTFARSALLNPREDITGLEGSMEIDLVPHLLPSSSHENIVKAIYGFSRYLFAYPTTSQDAKTITIAGVKTNIVNKNT